MTDRKGNLYFLFYPHSIHTHIHIHIFVSFLRLLIYDGHISHVWYGTTKLAMKYNMTIIKLPPHTTELLQPLDVAVFKSLKDTWGAFLFKRLKQARSRLTKSEFSTLLSSPEVWKEAFGEEKIKNGFRKCGIYPFSRDQYPKHRFHPKILAKYEEWVQAGKPAYSAEEFAEMFRENHERNTLEVTEDVDEVN